jgi:DNA-binding CsgD family transcriptional regulator
VRLALIVPDQAVPSAAAGRSVFVGRASELAVLATAAASARSGQPRVALVEGDAGIGKSTLLGRFSAGLAGAAVVLRASGDESEQLLPYGLISQLVASVGRAGRGAPGLLAAGLGGRVDPLAVGADVVAWLGQLRGMVLVVIDDFHWADTPSARALLFAVRRLQADQVLVLVSARSGELPRLGESWPRFLAGDHRAVRIRLPGLGLEEVLELGREVGAGELRHREARRLLAETGGNPLYCRAVLEEAAAAGLAQAGLPLVVPRSLAGVVQARMGVLSPAAAGLVTAAAVLGYQCDLASAAALAGLDDPLPALGEAVAAGILADQARGAAGGVRFTHQLVWRAVYHDLSPGRRRGLHARAANVLDRWRALEHRVAAAAGPDDQLAAELEAVGREAGTLGRTAQAANWLAQSAAVSAEPSAADRRALDALETLLYAGEVAEAELLAVRVAAAEPSARRSQLLGTVDFLAGRTAVGEARLLAAWHGHGQDHDVAVGIAAAYWLAMLCLISSRIAEAITWGERAARTTDAAMRHRALGLVAVALAADGRPAEGLARLASLPAAPAEVGPEDTDALIMRGVARLLADDLAGGVGDLSAAAARLRAGLPMSMASQCLSCLASAEWRLGAWDEAALHAELAVSLARDFERVWDLGFVHGVAAIVPAQRGDWETAAAHVRRAMAGGQAAGTAARVNAALMAQAYLCAARGDREGVIAAADAVRATGKGQYCLHIAGRNEWQILEIDALAGLGRLDEARTALAELDTTLSSGGPAAVLVAAERLHGDLALAAGEHGEAAVAFEAAWRRASRLRAPLTLAQLEISDARRLRAAGQQDAATARLRSARQRLASLGAQPYLRICDQELAAAGAAPAGPSATSALAALTTAEQAVARLVAAGRSNRQTAAELYVSIKTVEFHLRHIFDKLGIGSRKELSARLGASPAEPRVIPGSRP